MRLVMDSTVCSAEPDASVRHFQYGIYIALHTCYSLCFSIKSDLRFVVFIHSYLMNAKARTGPDISVVVGHYIINEIRPQPICFIDSKGFICFHVIPDHALITAAHPQLSSFHNEALDVGAVGNRISPEVTHLSCMV